MLLIMVELFFREEFDNEFYVKHMDVNCKENLKIFRNSKYVQSDVNDTFKRKNYLINGKSFSIVVHHARLKDYCLF